MSERHPSINRSNYYAVGRDTTSVSHPQTLIRAVSHQEHQCLLYSSVCCIPNLLSLPDCDPPPMGRRSAHVSPYFSASELPRGGLRKPLPSEGISSKNTAVLHTSHRYTYTPTSGCNKTSGRRECRQACSHGTLHSSLPTSDYQASITDKYR